MGKVRVCLSRMGGDFMSGICVDCCVRIDWRWVDKDDKKYDAGNIFCGLFFCLACYEEVIIELRSLPCLDVASRMIT